MSRSSKAKLVRRERERMSGKEKEKEDNEGEILLHHSGHEHPLSLTVVGDRSGICYGCTAYISPGEKAYTCNRCDSRVILHEECAEMPQEITLSSHPQHSLIQKEYYIATDSVYYYKCAVCEDWMRRIGYKCSSSDSCEFQVHLGCAHGIKPFKSGNVHPSHPQHHLTLQHKSCSFRCDACGTMQRLQALPYVCSDCQYWIHESCAALPPTRDFPYLHHHALSLAYQVPLDYIRFRFNYCRICFKILFARYWLYHCETCRYVVHINCAILNNSAMVSNINADAEGEDVISFPTKSAVEEMIGSFVAKVKEVKGEYKLHNSDHQLRLVSSSLHDQEEEEDEDDDDDQDELLYYGNKSEVVCDGCTMPILDKKQKKSSHKYISCGECKYFLHLACFRLPPELPSHPLHQPDHILTLQSCRKLDFVLCDVCGFHTNGLFYGCTKCGFQADVKCVSLPDTIKHESHPQHRLKLLTKQMTSESSYKLRACIACRGDTYYDVCYRCDICGLMLHASCCLLPAAVTNPTWDKQPLPLTFDASMNHPSSFYCEVCEEEMNPMTFMYHCRERDVSIHPECFPTASGMYRNIKFGQRYLVNAVHNHALVYQPLTKKLHCDVCSKRKVYGTLGFQCCSDKCEFFMCLDPCVRDLKNAMTEENSDI